MFRSMEHPLSILRLSDLKTEQEFPSKNR